ncbi:MAG: protein translocase subunit SecF [Micrococcaceae bacterium]
MASFAQFGNDLHSGKKSFNIVGKRKLWYLISLIAIVISIIVPIAKGGFNLGIEFRGGSEFRVSSLADSNAAMPKAEDTVNKTVSGINPIVTTVGNNALLIETDQLKDTQAQQLRGTLAQNLSVPSNKVTSSFVGPSWGADVTRSALIALAVFLAIVSLVMALYFRTWKMSLAALVALFHDLIITAGIYAVSNFEVTPATVIGFLTILGYSMYDTVVVFDKIRENTANFADQKKRTFGELVNLAVNQTLIRSINTSIVAVLPVASILFIGAFMLGAGTLKDLSLALFIGILVGTYSTIFIASPFYAHLRERDNKVAEHDKAVLASRDTDTETDEKVN